MGLKANKRKMHAFVRLCIFNDLYSWTARPLQAEAMSDTPVCPRMMSSYASLRTSNINKLKKKDAFMNEYM